MTDETELQPVEIEIPASEEQKQPETPEKQPKTDDTEAQLSDLRAQVEDHKARLARERAAREEWQRRAQENEQRAASFHREAEDGQLTAIKNAIRAVASEGEAAERAYADAMSNGDYNLAAKAQRQMAASEARLLQLENGKAALEERATGEQRERPEPIPRQRPAPDPVEELAATLTGPSADWVRSHKDAVRDPATLRKIAAAHQAAIDLEGLEPDTPEYFGWIEERVGLRPRNEPEQPPPPAQEAKPQATSSQKRPLAAAPVKNAASGGSRSSDSITLTPQMRELAHTFRPDLPPEEAEAEYARNRAAMIKEGKIPA